MHKELVVKHLFGSLVFRQCVNYRTAIAHAVGQQEEAYGHGSHGYEYLEEERQQGHEEHKDSKADGNDANGREHSEDNAFL